MKRFLQILCIALLFPLWMQAQTVTSTPSPINAGESVTITFKATLASNPLYSYDGDVYMHTGVSTNIGEWRYVIQSEWTDNNPKAKLTKVADRTWELTMPEGARKFYGVPDDEQITKVALVVRDSTGSKKGTPNDVFLTVNDPGLFLNMTPGSDQYVTKGQAMSISLTTTETCSLIRLLVNGSEIANASNTTTISKSHTFTADGIYTIKAEATSASGTKSKSISVTVLDAPQNEARPANVKNGANIISPTEVTFVLYAPNKKNVVLLGDFNDWQISSQYLLKKDGDYWWYTHNNLEAGKEYAFQYMVDGTLRVADPYTDKVLDPWNDQYISESVYPNLKAYPTGKTDGIVSVVQTAQTPYNWKVTDFKTPARENMIIYELLIRDFTEEHTFESTMQKLDYLQTLGVNVIELLPVNEFEGNSSWGYNPSFYFAVDKYYGTKDSFKAFVDECHRRGMAVVIDMVLNHAFSQCVFAQLYWDSTNSRPTSENPWFNVTSPNPTYSWGSDFNHESLQTQALVDSVNSYWMSEYKVDGFRFDFTKGFTNKTGDGWAYDQSRINILKRMSSEIYKRKNDAIVIFEHLTDNIEERTLSNADIMLWGNMSGNYGEGIMGYTESSKTNLSWGIYTNRGWTKPNLVSYMESHDEERMVYKAKTYGKVTDMDGIIDRAKLSAAFYLLQPGPKMIWQFGELGYDYSINTCPGGTTSDDCRTDPKPIRWDYLDDEKRKSLFDTYAFLNDIKKNNDVFNTTTFTYSLTGGQKSFVWKSTDTNAFIVGNFDVTPAVVSATLPKGGIWYNALDETSINLSSETYSETLQGGEFRLYVDKQLITGIEDNKTDDQDIIITDDAIYLNEDNANISDIYSINGILVKQSRNAPVINISDLQYGIYILKVQSGDGISVRKFIKR